MLINAVRLNPDSEELTVFYAGRSSLIGQNINWIGSMINRDPTLPLVATVYTNDYNDDLRAGVYISSTDEEPKKDEIMKLQYFKDVQEKKFPSNSIIAGRLLIRKLTKASQTSERLNQLLCHKWKIGSDLCLEFSHDKAIKYQLSDYLFDRFCEDHKNLCGEGKNDRCSKFFTVVKRFTLSILHSVNGDPYESSEKLYLVINISYGINMRTDLAYIIKNIDNNELSNLRGVKVNFLDTNDTKSSKNRVYEIEEIKPDKKITLKPIDENELSDNTKLTLDIDDSRYNVSINPVFKTSRQFLQLLCKEYDAFRRELDYKITPKKYYEILISNNSQGNLRNLVQLIENFMKIGEVHYTISKNLEEID